MSAWVSIAILTIYFIYNSVESVRRYREQKAIAKEENEKNRQAFKNALKEILLEIEKEK